MVVTLLGLMKLQMKSIMAKASAKQKALNEHNTFVVLNTANDTYEGLANPKTH